MNLKNYIDFYVLLQSHKPSIEENRAFGLETEDVNFSPFKQILLWVQKYEGRLKKPLLSQQIGSYLYGLTLTLAILAFLLGLFSGMGLLSYSGHEPVNVIYFLAMVVLLPLFTMTLTFFSMLKAGSSHSFLVHISPAFWMERVLQLLPKKVQHTLKEFPLTPQLTNWMLIKRSQLLALLFSLGLLVSLLGMVTTKDIAFAWSTTLQVSPQEFHAYLLSIAFAWRDLFPWAVPSLELIEQSQYFRLGENLDMRMIQNASKLGEWWKFLAFATLFYAILLRFTLWLFTLWGFKYALFKSFLNLEGCATLLREMNEPIISTASPKEEQLFSSHEKQYGMQIAKLNSSYDVTLGWAMSSSELRVLNDTMHVTSKEVFEVGGANSLSEDSAIISKSQGNVLFYVKSWEPPTMDFVDFLEELTPMVERVTLTPRGTSKEKYVATQKELEMWGRKLETLHLKKVWLKI